MRVEPTDQHIASWAERIAAPCYYVTEPNAPTPFLKVQCGHLTAYFKKGQLVRLWACADCAELDDMFKELSLLFRNCGTGRLASYARIETSV